MEKITVEERELGLSFGPYAPNNKLKPVHFSDFFYSSDAGARFQQHHHQQQLEMSRGRGMNTRMFPFTTAQWQELQRQALIYKHITASVPVPPHLLHPSAAMSFPETPAIFLHPTPAASVTAFGARETNGRMGSGADPEPGRCRRTDGKKWRCARDVAAPDQKYCERHLQRGRPRSRKPVEHRRNVNRCKASSPPNANGAAAVKGASPAAAGVGGLIPNAGLNLTFQSLESSEEPRREDWMKSYTESLASNGQWDQAMRQYEQLPNLNYTDPNESWCCFLNTNVLSLPETSESGEPPRRFIDAWSGENAARALTDSADESSVSRKNKLHLSTLTLSMSSGAAEDGMDNGTTSQPLTWLAPDSPLGGPLAEVLQSGAVSSPRSSWGASGDKNSADPINLVGNYGHCGSREAEASPRESPSRLVSSPSGVLHKALASLSDSSSSSSPTFAVASRSDFAFQWMNLNK